MVTLSEIESVAMDAKPDISEYLNCGYINRIIQERLNEELDVSSEVVIGGIWQTRGNREEHAYITIPATDVADSPQDVIVDGAIRQFCEQNRDDLYAEQAQYHGVYAVDTRRQLLSY